MKIRTKLRKWYYGKNKYINGGRGVISLFLALLMVPFLTIAGMLINAARVDSAIAVFDEALCNASNSTLGTYEEFLKERFGLLAMKQTLGGTVSSEDVMEGLSATFGYYMEENMKVLSNTYTSHEMDVEGIYPLADKNVLSYQILEYSKYRVPAKLIQETLSLESLVESFEKCLFSDNGLGILGILTSSLEVGNAFGDLGTNYETLKTEQKALDKCVSEYTKAYNAFEKSIAEYLELEAEKEEKLAELDPSDEKYEEDYAAIEAEYEEKLKTQSGLISSNKTSYSNSIDAVIKQLPKVKNALVKVQGSYNDCSSSIVSMAGEVIDAKISDSQASLDEEIGKLEKAIKDAGDDEIAKKQLNAQLSVLKQQKVETSNTKTTAKTAEKAYKAGLNELKVKVNQFNAEKYSVMMQELTALKGTVDSYNCDEITSELDKGTYYKKISGLLTLAQINEAEKHFVEEVTKSSIIGLINAIISFFDALLNIEIVESRLRAVIDTNYYNTTYGGLPSKKDRSVHPITTQNAEDEKLSNYYKELFGNYSVDDYVAQYSLDLFTAIENILDEFSNIKGKFSDIGTAIKSFLDFGNTIKFITACIGRIINNITAIFEYVAYMINGNGLVEKTLITGYANYMFSDRTTYASGSTLDGVSFSKRGQGLPPVEAQDFDLFGLSTIISALKTGTSNGTEKCFYGAEKEYLLFGSASEVGNQAGAFLYIYATRLITNIPILFNAEVNSIAAATTVFAPVVWLCFILIEPLIDTVIIVNGGAVDIIKTYAYMTPSGLDNFFSKITSIQIGKDGLDKAKAGLNSAFGVSQSAGNMAASVASEVTKGKKTPGILEMNYQKMMFLTMLFIPQDKLLSRMADIIEMESVENLKNNASVSKNFDLDYSYTYIRAEASFTMNEFIPLSNTGGLKSKKRIVYRGY